MVDFSTVTEFEKRIAQFFGAPYAVATDSCTAGLELCMRYREAPYLLSPRHTYLSVPMLANKLGIKLGWYDADYKWKNYYSIYPGIFDAAVYWERFGYLGIDHRHKSPMVCLSFQHQKHLSTGGRGGMILLDNEKDATELKKMSYDGRLPGIPWREQDIETIGYHYAMTPEMAKIGLDKLDDAITREPKEWTMDLWPDISKMKVFNK